jgi:hypothetical protein
MGENHWHEFGIVFSSSGSTPVKSTFNQGLSMNPLVLLLVLLLLFGGGGFYFGGPTFGGGGVGLIILVAIIIYLFGGFRARP